jgi:hypothetical protein
MKKSSLLAICLLVSVSNVFGTGYHWPQLKTKKNNHSTISSSPTKDDLDKDEEPEEDIWFDSKEFGLNVTTLTRNFIPFNLGQSKPGFIAFHGKFYGSRNMAFRFNVGGSLLLNITDIASSSKTEQFVYGSLGYEKRYGVHKNWYCTSGWDAFLSAGIFEEVLNDDIHLVIGASKFFGIEYAINDKIFIGTEAQLMFGGGTQFFYKVVYPNSLFFNIRIN